MALDNFRTIELIWDKANKSIIKTIKTASSDTTGRYLSVKILDGGQEVTLNNAKLQLYWEHPNFNTSGTDDFNTVNNGGLFKLTFSEEMLTNVGELNAHLVLTLTDGKITSDGFPIEVFKGADNGVVVPTNGKGLVEQVANKIDKGNVTLSDLTQEVKLAMTGGSVAIVGENAVGTEEIKDRSVTPNKTTFINLGKNLFRKSERVTDKYWARIGGKATLADNAQLDTMPTHIPVSAGETYYKNSVGHIFFTDDTDLVLSTVDSLAPAGAYIVPPNATRMYFNVYKGDVETYQIEKGDTETEYDDGGFSLSSDIKIDLSNTDLSGKQDKLIAGDGISIIGNTISSDIDIDTPINNLTERIDNLSMIYGEIPKYYKVNNTGDFTVFIPISDTEYGSYNFRRDSNEDYMKMRENGVYTKGGAISTSQINYGEVTNSFLSAISSDNPYALNVGTKVETNFKGYSIEIVTFADNRGGVWNIKIDGVDYGDYSTYSDVAMENKTLTIIDNLSDTNHKMVMEFIGDDPLNAPTSQARGWLKKTVDGAWTVKTKENSSGFTRKFDITESGSNKEFAFSISENPQQGNAEWFPQHNGVGTMFVTSEGVQSFVADGQEVNLETPTDLIPFIQGKFTQICFARLSRDTSDRAKMILNYNFNDVVNQYFEMEFLQPSVIHAGYVFQLPARQDYLGQIKTEKREVVEAQETIDTVHTPFKDLDAYEYIATSNNAEKSDYYLRQKITNRSDDIITLELQHRSSQFQKLYPRVFMQKEIVAGQKVWFDGEYEIGKLQNANKIYG